MSSLLNCSKSRGAVVTEDGIASSQDSGNMHTLVGEYSLSEISRSRSLTSLINVASQKPHWAPGCDAIVGDGTAPFGALAASLGALFFLQSPLLPSLSTSIADDCPLPLAPPIGGSGVLMGDSFRSNLALAHFQWNRRQPPADAWRCELRQYAQQVRTA